MSPILALLASRVWAAEPTALHAWATGKEALASLVNLGMSPRERAQRVVNGENPVMAATHISPAGVATVPVEGVLMHAGPWWAKLDGDATDYLDLRAALDDIAAEPLVREVVLAINSPGGDAVGLAETVAAIERVRAAGKPVRAHIGGMGASAAYFIASAADEITAEPDALVGSIGTMTVLRDTTALQDKIGIRLEVVSSGPSKGAGADGKITPELRADTQRRIDAFAAAFREQVAAGREMSAEQVAAIATGDYWMARDAIEKGLVDRLASGPAHAAAPKSTPAAAAATAQEEPTMALEPKTLAALAADHPTHAALILSEAAKEGATEATIRAAIGKADAAAKEQALAELKSRAEKAEKSLADEKARADKAEADLAKLKAHAASEDPGADGEKPKAKTLAEFNAMSAAERAAHLKARGEITE